MTELFRPGEVVRAIGLLKAGEPFEIRAIACTEKGARKKGVAIGYFDEPGAIVDELSRVESATAIYYNLNRISDTYIGKVRVNNRLKFLAPEGLHDKDIAWRSWLLVDCDPWRQDKNTSATDSEVELAETVSATVQQSLQEAGFPKPITAMSGNGHHLLYRLDMASTPATTELIQHFLQALSYEHSTEVVKVDTSVFNPSRISKLYGTLTCKGPDTTDRPHRFSRLCVVPEPVVAVSSGQLQLVAARRPEWYDVWDELRRRIEQKENRLITRASPETNALIEEFTVKPPKFNSSARPTSTPGIGLDFEKWAAEHGVEILCRRFDCQPVKYYVTCPWADEHSTAGNISEAAVFQDASGRLGFKCQHEHCQRRGWTEFRGYYEPEYLERKESWKNPKVDDSDSPPMPSGDWIVLPSARYEIIRSARDIFKRLGDSGQYFIRGGRVHEVGRNGLEVVSPEALRTRIENLGRTVAHTVNTHGQLVLTPKRPGAEDAKAMLASAEIRALPEIEIVSNSPVLFLRDNELAVAQSGYCAEAKCYVLGDTQLPQVSPEQAANELENLLKDFRFASPSDKTRALGLLISPALRFGGFIQDGRVPMYVIEADQSQTGKGYMMEVVASIYGERFEMVGRKDGGVGGFDESLSQRLVDGRPFVVVDNLRGKLDSQFLEMTLTAPGRIPCRVLHREVSVDPHKFFFAATSNGMESTMDMANRSCIIRILKQPREYVFSKYDGESLNSHVAKNQARYLACVHSLMRRWHENGAYAVPVTGHDFREWHEKVAAIVAMAWPQSAPMMQGHEAAQQRTADPALSWLRTVCLQVEAAQKLGEQLSASEIMDQCALADIPIPSLRDQTDAEAGRKMVGWLMSRVFGKSTKVTVDVYDVERVEVFYNNAANDRALNRGKAYRVTRSATEAGYDGGQLLLENVCQESCTVRGCIELENVTLSETKGPLTVQQHNHGVSRSTTESTTVTTTLKPDLTDLGFPAPPAPESNKRNEACSDFSPVLRPWAYSHVRGV